MSGQERTIFPVLCMRNRNINSCPCDKSPTEQAFSVSKAELSAHVLYDGFNGPERSRMNTCSQCPSTLTLQLFDNAHIFH